MLRISCVFAVVAMVLKIAWSAENPIGSPLTARTVPKRNTGEEIDVKVDHVGNDKEEGKNCTTRQKTQEENQRSLPSAAVSSSTPLLTASPGQNTIESVIQRQWKHARDWFREKCKRELEADSVSPYLRACAKYSLQPDGAVCAAARFGSATARPSRRDFSDGDLLALVEALPLCGFRAIDLSGVDGSRLSSATLALRRTVRDDLLFLALAPQTKIVAADRFFYSVAAGHCRYLKASRCELGDRGAEALARVLSSFRREDNRLTALERVDLSYNGIGPMSAARLRTAARSSGVLVDLRGNAAGLDLSCGLVQAFGAILAPVAGFFLISEARRLELDRGAVASCILYAVSASAYFALTAALYLKPSTSLNGAITLDAASRIATFLAVAGAHAPFLAFVDLGLPRHLGAWLWAACAALACANSKRKLNSVKWQRELLSPPALRHASLTHDKAPLVLLAGLVPFLRFIPLKSALAGNHRGFTCLVAAVLFAVLATALDLTPLCRPLACAIHLIAATLHYICVLTTLVWHFLPPNPTAPPGGGDILRSTPISDPPASSAAGIAAAAAANIAFEASAHTVGNAAGGGGTSFIHIQ